MRRKQSWGGSPHNSPPRQATPREKHRDAGAGVKRSFACGNRGGKSRPYASVPRGLCRGEFEREALWEKRAFWS